jgi:hypothetical protein
LVKYAEHVSIKRIGPVAWPGALALIVLMGLAPGIARAEDDQTRLWNQDKKIYEVFFGSTPKPTLEDRSENQGRPPLVVPPSPGLPPPQTSAPARYPNRPAEAPASRQAADKRKRPQAINPDQFTNPMPPSELRGAAAGSPATNAPNPPASDVEMTDNPWPSQLASPGGFFSMLLGGNNDPQEEEQPQLQQPQSQLQQQPALQPQPPPQTSAAARDPNRPVATPASRQAAAEKRRTAGDPEEFANPLPPSALRSAPGVAAANAPNRPASDAEMTDNLRPSQLGSPSPGGFFALLFGSNNGRQEEQPQQAQQPLQPPQPQQPLQPQQVQQPLQPQQAQQPLQLQPPPQVGALAGEPPRTRPIDPQAGYQTSSPSQAYGTARPANYGRPKPPDPLSE